MRAVVISNGVISDYDYFKSMIKPHDYIICADGAIRHCIRMNLIPDLWIGDFDSCHFSDYINKYEFLNDVERITLCPQKDVTDTHFSCNTAIERGYNEIVIWGALGVRMDHAISNINLLELLCINGVTAYIEDEHNNIRVFKDLCKVRKRRKYLSLIPMDENVRVIKTQGLLYPLECHTMKRYLSLGVSNEIIGEYATVMIDGGTMLCIESDDQRNGD